MPIHEIPESLLEINPELNTNFKDNSLYQEGQKHIKDRISHISKNYKN